jgi:hypothetical protein
MMKQSINGLIVITNGLTVCQLLHYTFSRTVSFNLHNDPMSVPIIPILRMGKLS